VPGWAPPHYNERDVSDKPAYVRNARPLSAPAYDLRGVCRSLLAVDEMVGAIRLELAAQARLGDTLLILTSDNGLNLGAHRLDRKSTPYSTRIPFMVSWPDRLGT
jgi:arylsulfatase A-like enzyme